MALEINDAFNKFPTNTNNIDKFKKKKASAMAEAHYLADASLR